MNKSKRRTILSVFILAAFMLGNTKPLPALAQSSPQVLPPFSGTIFLDPDIITPADPSTFISAAYTGQGSRLMFDRRVNNWITVAAYLFNATYSDGLAFEIQVNPEFGSSAAAQVEATKYGTVVGRLPKVLRLQVQSMWIHMGVQPFGGGNHNILIHTGQSALYEADGILEETLVHEASHTSLDAAHAASPGWIAAQNADGNFISTYGRDYPTQEDIAESFLPYLMVRYRPGRITPELAATISQTMPNRIAYFDSQGFNVQPLYVDASLIGRSDFAITPKNTAVRLFPLNNDQDPNAGSLVISSVTTPGHGTAGFIGARLAYTPTLNFTGTDIFTYTLSTGVKNTQARLTILTAAKVTRIFLPLNKR